ncbi:MAG: hypothetical protein RLZZ156_84 [Deinococcota bacterium]|jgi:uncharacterized protein involved in exopolysaccharide biosynthesis
MNETIPAPEQEISLRDVYLILKRNALIILVTPIIFAFLAALYAFFIADPVYKSEANLTIQTTPVQSKIEDKIETSAITVFTSDQIETVATSRPILDKLIEQIRTSNNAPTNWRVENFDASSLEKKLKIKFPKPNARGTTDASLVTLEVSAPNAKLAAEVANGWARETNTALNLLPQERVKDSINTLQGEINRAARGLNDVEKKYEEYANRSNLALEQAELGSATGERAGLEPLIAQTKQNVLQTEAELGRRTSDLKLAAQTLGVIPENSVILGVTTNGQTLLQVRTTLDTQLKVARNRMLSANEALRLFNTTNDAALLRGRIGQNEGRLLEINAKLQSFDSTRKTLTAQLQQARQEIKTQPKLLILERELLSDPAINAAIQSRDPKVNDLIGLKLQNQEVNPIYQELLQGIVGLEASIRTLTADLEGIKPESIKRTTQLNLDRTRLAQLNKQAEPLALEVRNAQVFYETTNAQINRLEGVDPNVLSQIRVENTNPEYQRLRTLVNDLSSNLLRFKVTLTGYETRAKELNSRIEQLKSRVATSTLESARIGQQLELTREQFKTLSQKMVDLSIEQASSKSLAQVLVPAFAPSRPASSRATVVLLAIVAGLLIGLIIPFILEALRDPNAVARVTQRRSAVPALAAED